MNRLNNYFQGKKILVTGGAGYLASALISLLKDEDCQIVRLDKKQSSAIFKGKRAKVIDFTGDVSIKETWVEVLAGIDIVFHFAAQTSVYAANENPVNDLNQNILPMVYLLETCRKKQLKPAVLFSSTVTVIGIPEKLPVDENHVGSPVTIYDLHKLTAENYLTYHINQGSARGAILRLSNVYGPGPASSSCDRGILNSMIRKAMAKEPLTVYGSGNYLRDYLYVEDAACAFLTAAVNIKRINGRCFVIGSGEGHTIAETINLVADRSAIKTGQRVDVVHIEPKTAQSPIEERNFVADSGQFSCATGWKARVSLIEGIDRTIESY